MDSAFAIAFLAVMLGIPIIMATFIVVLIVRSIRDRRAVSAAVDGSTKWRRLDPEDSLLETIFADLDQRRGHLLHALAQDDMIVVDRTDATRTASNDHRTSSRRILILSRRAVPGPRGVVQHAASGLLGTITEGIVRSLGAEPIEAPGWEWASVYGPDGGFLSAESGQAVQELLRPGERLRLGPAWVALSLPPGPLAPVLAEAEQRVRQLDDALRHG